MQLRVRLKSKVIPGRFYQLPHPAGPRFRPSHAGNPRRTEWPSLALVMAGALKSTVYHFGILPGESYRACVLAKWPTCRRLGGSSRPSRPRSCAWEPCTLLPTSGRSSLGRRKRWPCRPRR